MAEKKTLLVVTPTIRRAQEVLQKRYLGTFFLKEIYRIKYVLKTDDIRGYKNGTLLLYVPGFYMLRGIDDIKRIIRTHKFTKLN
jgi:ATP-dependent RNA circularization protein (DNA/RNA ligase family)